MGKNDLKNRNKGNSNGCTNNQPIGSADYFGNDQGEDSTMVYLFAPSNDKSNAYATFELIKSKITTEIQHEHGSDALRALRDLSLIHIPSPRDKRQSRMPSSA